MALFKCLFRVNHTPLSDHGCVAELIPPRHASPIDERESPLAEAIRQGWVRPAIKKSGIPPRRPVASLRKLLADLEEHRKQRP